MRLPYWLSALSTVVPREKYLQATRALHDARAAYHDERDKQAMSRVVIDEQREYIDAIKARVNTLEGERAQIRATLLALPVYEGLVGPAPLGMLVSELARDHTALEERIESVLDLILARRDMDHIDPQGEEYATLNQIAGLLQGQVTNAPDTVEGLD